MVYYLIGDGPIQINSRLQQTPMMEWKCLNCNNIFFPRKDDRSLSDKLRECSSCGSALTISLTEYEECLREARSYKRTRHKFGETPILDAIEVVLTKRGIYDRARRTLALIRVLSRDLNN